MPNAHPSRVLIVDDDSACRLILALALRKAGLEVDSVATGSEALEKLRSDDYQWMITDGRMAGMDGVELSKRARQLRPCLQMVMISAVYTNDDITGSPIEKIFPKPIETDELVDYIASGRLH
ncbi:MAG: response regulator [Elusimicrobia bacterium]|nr:response regulator [Elusimicrobiota bacterium]